MKKLIIGMLLIIPIIVILVVSLTASLVEGAYISVEDIEVYIESNGKLTLVEGPQIGYLSDNENEKYSIKLVAKVIPEHAPNKEVSWSIVKNVPTEKAKEGQEQINVLTINQEGYVKFHHLGEATIQVAAKDGNIFKNVEFYVSSQNVSEISLSLPKDSDNKDIQVAVGERFMPIVALTPANAKIEQRYLNWEIVQGKEYASVDENGIVTPYASSNGGKVKLRVSLKNPPEMLEPEKRFAEIEFTVVTRAIDRAFVSNSYIYTGKLGGTDLTLDKMPLSLIKNKNTVLPIVNYVVTSENAHIDEGNIVLNEPMGNENCRVVTIEAVDASNNPLDELKINFKQIDILNKDLWPIYENTDKVLMKIGTAGIYIPVVTKLEGKYEVVSNDEKVVIYDKVKNCIIAKGEGEATISVKIAVDESNFVEDTFTVKVVPAIYSLRFYFDETEDDVGIEMKRYFGKYTYNYDSEEITNELDFKLKYIIIHNADDSSGYSLKVLSSSVELAPYMQYINYSLVNPKDKNGDEIDLISKGYSISDNGILTTAEEGDSITVKARPRYQIYEAKANEIETHYKLNFISNGVNIGMPTKANREAMGEGKKSVKTNEEERKIEQEQFDKEYNDNLNAFTIDGFNKVNAEAKNYYDINGNNEDYKAKYSIVVQDSMIFNGKSNDLYTSIYGNGEYLRQIEEKDDSPLGPGLDSNGKPYNMFRVVVDDVLIQNVTIRASRNIHPDKKESLFNYSKAGNGIMIDGREHYFPNGEAKEGRLKNIQVKFTTIENAYYCMYIAAADVNLEGTLMRNSGQQTLYINTSVQNLDKENDAAHCAPEDCMNSNVNLKNTVFTNSINMSIGIIPADLPAKYDKKVPEEGNEEHNVPEYINYFKHVTDSDVKFEGFCDIYNWKTAQELDFSYLLEYFAKDLNSIKSNEKDAYDSVVTAIRGLLSANVDSTLNNMGWGDLYYKVDGVNYYQLAVARIGVHYPPSSKISDEDLKEIGLTGVASMELAGLGSVFVGGFGDKIQYPLYFYCYDKNKVAEKMMRPEDRSIPVISPIDVCSPNKFLFAEMNGTTPRVLNTKNSKQ